MTEDEKSHGGGGRPFVFHCLKCGESCKRKVIPVYGSDLERWAADGTMERVFLALRLRTGEDGLVLELTKGEDGHCALYHGESGKCTIHYNKPVDCRAFPLGYDGERHYVRFRDCPGIGEGEMTKEELAAIRADAEDSFRESLRMDSLLPALQAVIYRQIMEDSLKAVEGLSDEDRERLDRLMERMKGGEGGDDDVEEVVVEAEDEGGGEGVDKKVSNEEGKENIEEE